jgi:cell division septum initiation protein DivIVA
LEALESELARHAELEGRLRAPLVSAERASQETREQARREAEVIVSEANAEARRVLREAITEKERLLGEVRRVRALLRSALEVVDDVPREPTEDETAVVPPAADTESAPLVESGAVDEAGIDTEPDTADHDEEDNGPGMHRLVG